MPSTRGSATSAAPRSGPPGSMVKTPSGSDAASRIAVSAREDPIANSDGFQTTALPAMSPGNSFQAAPLAGAFQGVIAATTPSGAERTSALSMNSSAGG